MLNTSHYKPRGALHAAARFVKRVRRPRRVLYLKDVVRVCGRGATPVLARAKRKDHASSANFVSLVTEAGGSVDLEFPTPAVHRAMLQGFTKLIKAATTLTEANTAHSVGMEGGV